MSTDLRCLFVRASIDVRKLPDPIKRKIRTRRTVKLPRVLWGDRSTPKEPRLRLKTWLLGWHHPVRRTRHSWRWCRDKPPICFRDRSPTQSCQVWDHHGGLQQNRLIVHFLKNYIWVEKIWLFWYRGSLRERLKIELSRRKIEKLNGAIGRLSLLHSHDALVLLKTA